MTEEELSKKQELRHKEIMNRLDGLRSDIQDLVSRVDEQNGRIGELESWRNYAVGFVAAALPVAVYILREVINLSA